jgi:hypothetical protein
MYEYRIVQLGIDGSRATLEEIAATPILTDREMEEFIEDKQLQWVRKMENPNMALVVVERTRIQGS